MVGVWVALFYFWLRGWCWILVCLFDFVFVAGSFAWWVRGLSSKLFWWLGGSVLLVFVSLFGGFWFAVAVAVWV